MKKLNLLAVTALLGATLLTGCGRPVASSVNLPRPTRPITPAVAQSVPGYTAPTGQVAAPVQQQPGLTQPGFTQPTLPQQPGLDAGLGVIGGGLEAEVTTTKTVTQKLIFKRLSVTFKVTNTGATPLSGSVKVDFYGTPGLTNFTRLELVETKTQAVANLAPGQSAEYTLVSSKSAKDAQVAVLPAL